MAAAARNLVGSHDFRHLAAVQPADRNAVRTVHRWEVRREKDNVIIECEANGFLRHLVRRANALLIDVGRGRLPQCVVRNVLEGEWPEKGESPSVPAYGLCLMKVTYPNFWSQVCTGDETN
jgi:tRNA pseudouridine38-40 synthase